MKYTAHEKVTEARHQDWLNMEKRGDDGSKDGLVIDLLTLDFGDGWQADIKLVNVRPARSEGVPSHHLADQEGCYIDAVLFKDGHEQSCYVAEGGLTGHYVWIVAGEHGDDLFTGKVTLLHDETT